MRDQRSMPMLRAATHSPGSSRYTDPMLWFAVWTVLVLGAIVCAVLVGRRLWRSFKALMDEASRSGQVVAQLDARIAELDKQRADQAFRPHLTADARARQEWRRRRRENLAARAARVRARRSRTLERWRAIGLPF